MASLRIGITGGIGSGKSIVCKIFALLGAPTYDADTRARSLMTDDQVLVDQIKEKFGNQSYYADHSLNRQYLSKEVFNDPEKLREMNELVHPRVALDSEKWMNENDHSPYIVKEAALLFESGAHKVLDKIIVVSAPEALRLQRVINRDKRRTEEVLKIIRNQWPEEEKINLADFVIVNDEAHLIIPQVLKLHERFINRTKD
jgi:dephospho-CoA kinase